MHAVASYMDDMMLLIIYDDNDDDDDGDDWLKYANDWIRLKFYALPFILHSN